MVLSLHCCMCLISLLCQEETQLLFGKCNQIPYRLGHMFRAESKLEDSEDLGWFDATAGHIQFQDMDEFRFHLAYTRIPF